MEISYAGLDLHVGERRHCFLASEVVKLQILISFIGWLPAVIIGGL